jgi:hypothetical protein
MQVKKRPLLLWAYVLMGDQRTDEFTLPSGQLINLRKFCENAFILFSLLYRFGFRQPPEKFVTFGAEFLGVMRPAVFGYDNRVRVDALPE